MNKVSGGAGERSHRACPEATSTSSVFGLAGSQVGAAGSSHHGKLCAHSKMLRFGLLNLGTLRKQEGEVVETLNGRNSYLYGVQGTKWWGGLWMSQNRLLTSKDSCNKLFRTGNRGGWFRHPSSRMLAGERIWHCSHLRLNHPAGTSNLQESQYHHISRCPQPNLPGALRTNSMNGSDQ